MQWSAALHWLVCVGTAPVMSCQGTELLLGSAGPHLQVCLQAKLPDLEKSPLCSQVPAAAVTFSLKRWCCHL